MDGSGIAVGQRVRIDGHLFTVTKLAGKEIRLERKGEVKYRAVRTVERLLESGKHG